MVVSEGLGLLDTMPQSPALPAWLTEEDIQAYAEDFAPLLTRVDGSTSR
ncbi:hypothetical protein SALBM311S_11912 [Streptomyces alboniger]